MPWRNGSPPYTPGRRTRDWIKSPLRHTQEVIIGGWTPSEGRRTGTLGALLLCVHDERGRLLYAGHVGTGFTDRSLDEMHDRLAPLTGRAARSRFRCRGPTPGTPAGSGPFWSARCSTASGPATAGCAPLLAGPAPRS